MQENTKFCTNCGKSIPANAGFCPFCGHSQAVKPNPAYTAHQNNQSHDDFSRNSTNTTQQNDSQPNSPAYNENSVPGLMASTTLYLHDAFTMNKRMGRADYWWATLGVGLLCLVASFAAMIILVLLGTLSSAGLEGLATFVAILMFVVWFVLGIGYLGLVIAALTAEVRRFHDLGYTGALWLLNLIPGVGGLIVLIMMCQPSRQFNNPYIAL